MQIDIYIRVLRAFQRTNISLKLYAIESIEMERE